MLRLPSRAMEPAIARLRGFRIRSALNFLERRPAWLATSIRKTGWITMTSPATWVLKPLNHSR